MKVPVCAEGRMGVGALNISARLPHRQRRGGTGWLVLRPVPCPRVGGERSSPPRGWSPAFPAKGNPRREHWVLPLGHRLDRNQLGEAFSPGCYPRRPGAEAGEREEERSWRGGCRKLHGALRHLFPVPFIWQTARRFMQQYPVSALPRLCENAVRTAWPDSCCMWDSSGTPGCCTGQSTAAFGMSPSRPWTEGSPGGSTGSRSSPHSLLTPPWHTPAR